MYRTPLLIASSLLLIVPKLMLVAYLNAALWADFGVWDVCLIVAQDLLFATIVFCLLFWTMKNPTRMRVAACFLITSITLLVLFIDARVRQLWLKPLDFSLIGYYWSNAGDLTSGISAFLKYNAGFGVTFRKWLFFALSIHACLWVTTAWVLGRKANRTKSIAGIPRDLRLTLGGGAMAMAAFIIMALMAQPYLYSAEKNILVGFLIPSKAKGHEGTLSAVSELADACDQKLRPSFDLYGDVPSKFSGRLKPFRNVIIVIMESVRWKGLGPDASAINARAPTIGKLATEGTLARCYVSIPHSSKAEFAILTGRNALAGIEIRESMKDRFPSVMWSLQERRSARTFCFSVQNLLFENTIGMLRACGIQTCIGPQELLSRSNTRSDPTSSFGESDELLLNGPRRLLADCNDPFAAVYMTLSAHYPYEYPSKYPKDDHSIESYWKSIAYLDSILGKLFAELKGGGLLEDTLLVLVGDHGESFGEHGTYIHNNSMYEEEISVPLVFWSADGRLKNSEVQTARQIDIAPSIADLMSIDDKDYLVQGRSIFRKCPEEPIYVSSFFEGVSMAVIAGRHKTIWFPDNNRVLKYDLFLDPHEQESMDLSESEHRATIQRLRAFDAYQRRIFD